MKHLENIKTILKEMKSELAYRFHVNKLGLFGSVTRADFTGNSDIDIIVDFSEPIGIEFVDLAEYLEEKLKRKVDLVSRNAIKARFFQEIQGEIQYV